MRASTKKRPTIMYRPMRTNGIPQIDMNPAFGPLKRRTLASQKMAKPPHSKLNGIMYASLGRNRIPCRGVPDQMSDSPESRALAISFCGAKANVVAISAA